MKYSIAIVLIVLVQIWLVIPLLNPGFWARAVPIVLVLALAALRQVRTGNHWGLKNQAFVPAAARALLVTLPIALAAGLAVSFAPWKTSFWSSANVPLTLGFLFIWALGQQFALQTVILEESLEWFKDGRKAVLAAAGIFAILHLPNPFLTIVTGGAAAVWCSIYRRYPNIVPLAISHAVSSLAIMATLTRDVTGGMRIGYSYLAMWMG